MNGMTENSTGFLLELSLVVVPVDEPRSDERREQDGDNGSADDQVKPVQDRLRLSPALIMMARRSCLGS
jgi:hypothetical protein